MCAFKTINTHNISYKHLIVRSKLFVRQINYNLERFQSIYGEESYFK
jgi:hypothetical protein